MLRVKINPRNSKIAKNVNSQKTKKLFKHNHFIYKCKLILYPKVRNSITHLSNVITPTWLNSVFLYLALLSKTLVSFVLEFFLNQVTL